MLIKFHLPISKIPKTLHLQCSLAIAIIIIFNCIYCDVKSQNIINSYDSQNFDTHSTYNTKQISSQEVYHYPNQQPVNSYDLIISELDYGKGGIYDGRKPEDEIITSRDATSKHFRTANGSYEAIITAGAPLNYFENGVWKTCRKEILTNATSYFKEYDYANITNTQKTFYSKNSTNGLVVEDNGYIIKEWLKPEIAWLVNGSQLNPVKIKDSKAEIDLNKLSYKNCFAGIDVCFTQEFGSKKLDYILKDNSIFSSIPEGAEYMAVNETIILPDGWTYKTNSFSCIYIYNENSECVYTYLAPEYYDSNPKNGALTGKYILKQEKNELLVTTLIPVEWLTASERIFPITIDPTTTINALQGGWQSPPAGYNDDSYYNFIGFYSSWYRGWAKFNTSSINDLFTINNAALTMYCNGAADAGSVIISAYSIETYYGPYSAYNVNYYNDLGDGTNYNNFSIAGFTGYYGPFTLTGAPAHIQTQLPNDRFQIGFTSTGNWKRFGPESYISVVYTTAFCITNFYPMSACYNSGEIITIEGYEFTGATDVQINGISCPFTVINENTITASVLNGATSGFISVTTPAGTKTSAYQISINSVPSNPTTVIATPTTICLGGYSDLNASSAGNIINWYTVPIGGTSIGSSNSDEDFPINPISTTTYYAESQNGGRKYYINSSVGALWAAATNDPINAMNTVFGAGNWTHEYFESVNISELLSSNTSFIYLEGSYLSATELEAFLTANITDIENWVSNGGHLLLKSGPNEDNGMSFGFGGVAISSPNWLSYGEAIVNNHQVFNSPYLPCGTYFTGNPFALGYITGPGLTSLMNGAYGRVFLAERNWGSGKVVFSGMTLPYYWNPDPNSSNLLNNIINYLGSPKNCTCDNRIAVTITVIDDPSLSDATFTDNEICIGVSTNVSSTLTGGTDMSLQWEYSSDNVNWNSVTDNTPTDAVYTNPTTENLTVSGITAIGTYYYRLSATSTGEGCNSPVYSNSGELIVYTEPSITASNDGPYCVGNDINLSATGTSGVTYSWIGPDTFSDSDQNPQITNCINSNNGIYTVIVEDPDGCTASSQTTVVVDTENPTASNPDPISIECDSDLPAPDISVVIDEADNATLIPTVEWVEDISDNNYCPEVITRNYKVSDDCLNSIIVSQTITIIPTTLPSVPIDESSTVECIDDAIAPTTPIVTDQCGNNILPVLESMTDSPDPINCEGIRTYKYSYADCAGNISHWEYTYIIDLNTAPLVSADEFSTVECVDDAVAPTTPIVFDECGNNITPVLESMTDSPDPIDCEGTRTYVYSYTDCASNVSYWEYVYTIDLSTAPIVSADEFSTVECVADAVAPTTPIVTDQCGNIILPVLESMTDSPDPIDCEGTRTYVYSYTDCASNVSYWEYVYTIDLSTDPIVSADEFSTVECLADAVAPT
ncbi:MAG TPA: hypothetical protein PKN32_12880, partial [Bacteroidales bacterium]|nr:hypothetical protein [Bacteroidales bacterium]